RFIDAELRLAVELGAQRLAFDKRHYVVEESICAAAVKERQNIRMLQRRSGCDLLNEPVSAEYGRQFRLQYLDRDVAVVLDIVREVHVRHTTLTELALDRVPIYECGGESFGRSHRAVSTRIIFAPP